MVHVSYAGEDYIWLFFPGQLNEPEPCVPHMTMLAAMQDNPAWKRLCAGMIAGCSEDLHFEAGGVEMSGEQSDDSLRSASAKVRNQKQ
jgi:hypothetical protein